MNKVKIAILDTGLDIHHEYFENINITGYGYNYIEHKVIKTKEYQDDHGHGTACASLIVKECKSVEIVAIKILDKNGSTNLNVLEYALSELIDSDVSVINLSISLLIECEVEDLYHIICKLYNKGKILVASVANGYDVSYPAAFHGVIGVLGFILEKEDSMWFNPHEKIQCIMDNNPTMVCSIGNRYKLPFKCNSFPAARVSGIICNMLSSSDFLSRQELINLLCHRALRTKWYARDFKKSLRYPDLKKGYYPDTNWLVQQVFEISKDIIIFPECNKNICDYRILYSDNILDSQSCYEILSRIQRKLKIEFNFMKITRYDLLTIGTLTHFLLQYIK